MNKNISKGDRVAMGPMTAVVTNDVCAFQAETVEVKFDGGKLCWVKTKFLTIIETTTEVVA